MRINVAGDYFLLPSCMEIFIVAELKIREENGNLRNILPSDCLVPVDGLNFIRNIRPQIDGMPTIPTSKDINQSLYHRVIDCISKSTNPRKLKESANREYQFFENRTEADAEGGKTHSHTFDKTLPKKVKFSDESQPSTSKQNLTLAKTITNEFVCPLNFSTIAPFDVGKVSIFEKDLISIICYYLMIAYF